MNPEMFYGLKWKKYLGCSFKHFFKHYLVLLCMGLKYESET